ncbi:hypothetical protein Lal_00040735 [Lupinus albus]|nr:hypothetical protein Lal_00040735 [Lupinus albus]
MLTEESEHTLVVIASRPHPVLFAEGLVVVCTDLAIHDPGIWMDHKERRIMFRVKETLLRKVLQTPNMAIFSSFLSWADMDFFSTMIEGIQAATFLIQDSIVHRSGL